MTRWLGLFAVSLLGCGVQFTGRDGRGGDAHGSSEAGGGGASASGGNAAMGGGVVGGAMGGTSEGGAPGGAPGTGGSAGGCTGAIEIVATVADCVDVATPDPDACEAELGVGHMWIDTNLTATGSARHIFLRFDPPPIPPEAVSAELVMTVSDHGVADADQTGELWATDAFTRADLFGTVPANSGGAAVGADQGSVVAGAIISWTLPLAALSGPLHLALRPVTSSAPVYWNLNGTAPPKIVVRCR